MHNLVIIRINDLEIMKKLLLLFALTGISLGATAQDGIEIFISSHPGGSYTGSVSQANFATHDFSGETAEFTPIGQNEIVVDLHIENHTGETVSWIVSRRRVNEISSWTDFLCWGHETDNTGGLCIDAGSMDSSIYSMPSQTGVTIQDSEAGILAAHINPDQNAPGCVTYRYYVGTGAAPFTDSVDIEVCFSLNVDDNSQIELNVAPNPVNDFVKISSNGAEGSMIEIVDVFGNSVRTEMMDGASKTINTADLKNGVYFLRLIGEEIPITSKKIVVRH